MRRALLAVVHHASNERSLMSRLLVLKFQALLTTQKSSSNLARSRNGLMAYFCGVYSGFCRTRISICSCICYLVGAIFINDNCACTFVILSLFPLTPYSPKEP